MIRRRDSARGPLDSVAKKLRLPFGTPDFIDRIIDGSVDQVGRRTLYILITTWDAAGGGPFATNAIATTGLLKTADIVQKSFAGPVFDPVLKALGTDRIRLRASLCAAALIGIGIMRYTVQSEPIHSMDVGTLVDAMAPTLQRYMVGDLS
jgi:hypothetical protein